MPWTRMAACWHAAIRGHTKPRIEGLLWRRHSWRFGFRRGGARGPAREELPAAAARDAGKKTAKAFSACARGGGRGGGQGGEGRADGGSLSGGPQNSSRRGCLLWPLKAGQTDDLFCKANLFYADAFLGALKLPEIFWENKITWIFKVVLLCRFPIHFFWALNFKLNILNPKKF
jgi:hypothetical protein